MIAFLPPFSVNRSAKQFMILSESLYDRRGGGEILMVCIVIEAKMLYSRAARRRLRDEET